MSSDAMKQLFKEADKKKPKRIWDNYVEIAEVQKNERLKFVIAAGARDGFRCLCIREFYLRKQDQVWRPGRDGIIIPLVAPLGKDSIVDGKIKTIRPLEDLLAVLPDAINFVSTMELADPDNEIWYP